MLKVVFFCCRLPSPYNKQTGAGGPGCGPGGTSIPLPATVAATRRCPPDKVRPAPAPAHQTQLGKSIDNASGHPSGWCSIHVLPIPNVPEASDRHLAATKAVIGTDAENPNTSLLALEYDNSIQEG